MVELGIRDVDRTHPEIAKMIGRGSFWVLADRRCLVAQRNSQGRVRVYLTFHADADWVACCGIPFDSHPRPEPPLPACCPGGPGVHRPVGRLRRHGHTLANRVTLFSDAAHLMPPVGEGANMAMLESPTAAQDNGAPFQRPPDVGITVIAAHRSATCATHDGTHAFYRATAAPGHPERIRIRLEWDPMVRNILEI